MATYHYHYDPLDRLIQTAGIQRFYNQSRMTTEIEGTQRYSVFQQDGRLLAQRRRDSTKDECHLLGTDLQQSVLHAVGADKHHSMAYNAYGHRPVENGLISLLGFNGERADPVTGHYLLGNGYRAFNPVLMRFNSPDSWSPFGRGGINSYGYCGGEPINRVDRNGHFFGLGSLIKNLTFALDKRVFRIMGAKVKRAFNVQKLAEGVYQYEYPSKRGATLVVQAHGDKLSNGDTAMFSGKNHFGAEDLVRKLEGRGVDVRKFDEVELISCHLAEGAFPQQMANLTGLPVKAYKGMIWSSDVGLALKSAGYKGDVGSKITVNRVKKAGLISLVPESELNYHREVFFPQASASSRIRDS
ncbi:RHS repeat-associated core domain-containing protein [Pseudomonas lundensis]|uniref:RHS repeat-associated core domain-containing protein n=1 Tax=Pseudomonas lundensis TaxID=86185 RepID=UPI001473ED38|nr:RHS repeat-associated core domain-containing protein [Pseudomonas lundensis]NNA16181.1 RHS repeat-associated core domain-containing protein [Pseudomonas lundensis]